MCDLEREGKREGEIVYMIIDHWLTSQGLWNNEVKY